MVDTVTVLTAIGLAGTLYGIIDGKIKEYAELQKEYAKRLAALRKEVQDNIIYVYELMKRDTGAKAVYDPVVRRYINALRYKELQTISGIFEPVLGKHLKKAAKKGPNKKDPMRIFWNIKDAARKLEDLHNRMAGVPAKPARNAPRILLMRRLPALQWRLKEIDQALKIIPVKRSKPV